MLISVDARQYYSNDSEESHHLSTHGSYELDRGATRLSSMLRSVICSPLYRPILSSCSGLQDLARLQRPFALLGMTWVRWSQSKAFPLGVLGLTIRMHRSV